MSVPAMVVATLVVATLVVVAGPLYGQESSVATVPCDTITEHRQFDFWIGEWEVVDTHGEPLGVNSITRPEQECMLLERWESAAGSRGTSINYFDPAAGRWVQHWVAATSMLDLEGGLTNGAMQMEGHFRQITDPGSTTRVRGTWTPLDDGRVRQLFETWNETAEAWEEVFEGYYVRKDTTDGRRQ